LTPVENNNKNNKNNLNLFSLISYSLNLKK
jgi:hypothetical protein